MFIIDTLTGTQVDVRVLEIEAKDFRKLDSKRYFFNWKKYKAGYLVYKLLNLNEDDILGVMALIDVPGELRMEITLICCSRENYSGNKKYDRITGCLIAFACRESIRRYGDYAAVSLLPKTKIREHYKNKYGMAEAGKQLVLLGNDIANLINEYL